MADSHSMLASFRENSRQIAKIDYLFSTNFHGR